MLTNHTHNVKISHQHGFLYYKVKILFFLKNGIDFDKLTQIHFEGLSDIVEWLFHGVKWGGNKANELLRQEKSSPAKSALIEEIINVIDENITREASRLRIATP